MGSRGMRVHDPSTIVKCKDEYWIFHTGRGVSTYRSKDLVQWTRGPRIFTNAPAWVAEAVPENRGMSCWAPDVIQVDGQYFVYYSVSSFGRNTSAIALVTNPTLDPDDPDYKWTDHGIVVQSKSSDDYNAIDPALFRDDDGRLWMSFGSFWSGIKLIELDPKTGKRVPDSKMYSLAHFDSIEAPFICKHDGKYYLFVNWGMCCRGLRSTYNIRIGRSDTITGPYLDKDGKDMLLGGGTLFLGTEGKFIGPGHAGIYSEGGTNWFGMHFYDGTRPNGDSTLAIRTLSWGADGWPVLDPPK
ncbi:MAG TPA: arabinan endo-1,5-alpha-L-arabinosidase [Verrucomicrobia bacterium]|nr:arabinan endo-1,5-alpha-L-arabinosidase [Verrucomicrobiota bacterium]HOB32660.1 arabinan endo-1,5-alpha-L-arabinosidase [Verrucomicrobiota bacterium]